MLMSHLLCAGTMQLQLGVGNMGGDRERGKYPGEISISVRKELPSYFLQLQGIPFNGSALIFLIEK